MYQPQDGYPSRSPPPLQHPIPTHPPFKVPDPPISPNPVPQTSVTDPHVSSALRRGGPAANLQAAAGGGYQRFASPPIQSPPNQSAYASSSYVSQQPNQGYFPGTGAAGAQQQGWGGFPGFGGAGGPPIMNDATAQMGVQFGQHMAAVGGEYVQKNFNALLPMPVLKHYFNVSNSYVLHKLRIVLFPWRHKPWSRAHRHSAGGGGVSSAYSETPSAVKTASSGQEGYLPPRDDVNSPDLYIPTMAFVTYIILTSVILGLESRFHPEVLGLRASRALAIILIELAAIKLGTYLLNIQGDHTMMDLLAYSGYKFVGTLITLMVGLLKVRVLVYWSVFLYCFAANAFFLLRSLRYVVLPDPSSPSSQTITHAQRSRRIQFLFCIAVAQIVFGWALIIGIFKDTPLTKAVKSV
ncbi:related to YIF1 - protein required for the fusion of COPII transport vesicles with the Golgi [Ustilago sp. UG-2017b]|nr:related to YIF1 - protein required for the fusion of COPII transport vesicles with the Golgi [Ustilago sp. UG-2017b]